MRPVVRGDWPKDESENDIRYSDYQNARGELITRLGEICSYCEMHLDSSLAVEHVRPKNPENANVNVAERELDWDNFLLACTNCNSTKGNDDVILGDYFWPDRDNTFLALAYSEGGIVRPSNNLTPGMKVKATATIQLTGLNKHPIKNPKASDRRWQNRRETWDIAMESKQDLSDADSPQMRRQIVRSVHGYWSIWMTVFNDDADMLQRFITAFKGTCEQCFDANNGYVPIARTGGQC